MNNFSRALFQFMLGWLRYFSDKLDPDRLFSTGGVLDSWLSDNWLGLAFLIIIICTVIDFAVWFLRWKPHLVWRSGFFGKLRDHNSPSTAQMRSFHRGYREDNADISAIATPLAKKDIEAEDAQGVSNGAISNEAFYDWQFQQASSSSAEQGAVRKRRSDRYKQRVPRAGHGSEKDEAFAPEKQPKVNGLPPVMSKEEAFRAPVYPHEKRREDRQ